MIVDGHVGKVFSRTGLLDTVEHVKDTTQIHAQKMREQIEELVASVPDVAPFYVDDGAFYLYEDGFDTDLEPKLPAPSGRRPKKGRERKLREPQSSFDDLLED